MPKEQPYLRGNAAALSAALLGRPLPGHGRHQRLHQGPPHQRVRRQLAPAPNHPGEEDAQRVRHVGGRGKGQRRQARGRFVRGHPDVRAVVRAVARDLSDGAVSVGSRVYAALAVLADCGVEHRR
uniref:(northern house mosquito) hypothetical protein n=1 Tax=Culex pipiens TaxID=7175 RepID=A0A8D8KMB9_CULPI